jgi:uncharacterized protein with PIN domain
LRQAGDPEVVAVLEEGRILLTRNRRAAVWHKHGKVLAVEANNPKEQLLEVARKLPLLQRDAVPFSRCLECNRVLRSATRKEVREAVPEYIWQTHEQFHRCDNCLRTYWSGSHCKRMRQQLQEIFQNYDELK